MSDVGHLPAFDRVQDRPEVPETERPAGRVVLLVVLVLVGIGLAAWWLWPSEVQSDNVLVQLAETSVDFQPDLLTTRPDEAQAFVLETLGWLVAPPDLPGLALVGVGLPAIGSVRATSATTLVEVQIPAFRYEGGAGERAMVYAYDYILLDRIRDAYDLPEGTYAGLSEPTPVDSRVVDGTYVVTWRERAMIFSAVTDSEATADRIRQAVGA